MEPLGRDRPAAEAPRREGCRLEVSALLESTTHVAGLGWRLTTEAGPGPVRTRTLYRGRTRIFSELTALRYGLREAVAVCPVLEVRLPDPRAVALLSGGSHPHFARAESSVAGLRPLLSRFRSVRFESLFEPDPELRHAVGEALDTGLHEAAERQENRALVMERIIERAKEVVLERDATGWVANGRYRVSLDPLRCECPAWTTRWSRAPIAGKRAQRLPCKHLVALAMHEGISVPADLAALARRAPP